MHRQRGTRVLRTAVTMAAVAALTFAAGCGGDDDKDDDATKTPTTGATGPAAPDLKGQTVDVAGVWTGDEQAAFKKVLAEFEKLTGAKTNFVPTGDSASTFLGSKVEGGAPPDVAFLAQPGAVQQFAQKGWIKPVTPEVQATAKNNFTPGWQKVGTYQDKLYGIPFKGANKSLVWYNAKAFTDAGAAEPKTWDDFLKTMQAVSDSGTPPISFGGADGWTLTDWFENVYLSQAGGEKYDQLAQHKIKWTDESVKQALTTLAQVFGKGEWMPGGPDAVLQTEFPASVTQVFGDSPKAAMTMEGDFVATNILKDTKAKIGTDAKVFPFPAVGTGKPPVVTGGDIAVAMKDSPGAMALMNFLASPDAAKVWAQQGGYLSPNKSLDVSAYKDETLRKIAQQLIAAGDDFRFDLSDQAPAAFGGTKGEGMWRDLQDFLKNPSDIAGAQAKLEANAAKAYGG